MSSILSIVILAALGSPGFLGVSLDVLPAAYTFAASRLSYAPDLRLTKCDRTTCRWATGHGVELVAHVPEGELDIDKIEIDATDRSDLSATDKLWFERACSTVVALALSGAEATEIQKVTRSILPSSPAVERRERYTAGVHFYGSSSAIGQSDQSFRQRCGATSERR